MIVTFEVLFGIRHDVSHAGTINSGFYFHSHCLVCAALG